MQADVATDICCLIFQVHFLSAVSFLSYRVMHTAMAHCMPGLQRYATWLYDAHSRPWLQGAPADTVPILFQR
jgi:hypothetical protein